MFCTISDPHICKHSGMIDFCRHYVTPTKSKTYTSGFLSEESAIIEITAEKRFFFVEGIAEYLGHKEWLFVKDSQHYYTTSKKQLAVKRIKDFLKWCKLEQPSLQLICSLFITKDMQTYLHALLPQADEEQAVFLHNLTAFAQAEAKQQNKVAA